jgi:diguanylate cyclase (GGDEF)-like protein
MEGTMTETTTPFVVIVSTGMASYQSRLAAGIHRVLSGHGLATVFFLKNPSSSPCVPPGLVRILRRNRPCGVIATTMESGAHEQILGDLLTAMDIPTVYIGVDRPDTSYVSGDNLAGMRALMAHLLDERGARRPVLVRGIRHQKDSRSREEIFNAELAHRGIPVDEDLVIDGEFWHDTTYRRLRTLLRRRRDFDAVVALNDLSALGALSALTSTGLRVPTDVMVTGFDNEDAAAQNWPGLTTVDQDLPGQGAAAATHLLALIDGAGGHEHIVVPSRLVVRGSTATGDQRTLDMLDNAVTMAGAAQTLLGAQDAVLSLNRALLHCRTLDEVIEAFGSSLERLGIERCFLAVHTAGPGQAASDGTWARLILDYRNGRSSPPPEEVFPSHQILPGPLQGELTRGILAMQSLSIGGHDRAYMMFEQVRGPAMVGAVLHMDLHRTLEAVFITEELEHHAATLESTVADRTKELQAEIATRRRTEHELQAEIATRRRTEHELQQANIELNRLLMHDALTRIANRSAFQQHLTHHWARRFEEGSELALLMVDVDQFKAYNDRYGHVAGDEALQIVAACLARSVRDGHDLACRYGGEEFAVLLPNSGLRAALQVAARFRDLLADAAIPHDASPVADVVTASIGIAVVVPLDAEQSATLIETADQALYQAKALGRNRVAVAGQDPPVQTGSVQTGSMQDDIHPPLTPHS